MEQTKTSVFSNSMIWFGAAVSIAEILTGTLIAPLGFTKGIFAIILGHLIGCALLYFAGLIGAKTQKSAMETVKISFGEKGSFVFSSLNILQLLGWTAVMIVSGAAAANSIVNIADGKGWSIIIGLLIIVWIAMGFKNLDKVNIIAIGGLFILTIILSVVVFRGHIMPIKNSSISFGAAVELSVAMPLSWLPLISDYTRLAKKKTAATFASSAVYFAVSCWMYIIGMGASLFTGQSDIGKIMMSAGLGISGLIIIIFSTVTTTFLDSYSAGVSCVSIYKKVNEKWAAITVCIIGTLLAVFTPVTQFENFLYIIGSIFAPMTAILITDFFVLKNDSSNINFNTKNIIIWIFGFILYRIFMKIDTPVGNTLPVMLIICVLCIILDKLLGGKKNAG